MLQDMLGIIIFSVASIPSHARFIPKQTLPEWKTFYERNGE